MNAAQLKSLLVEMPQIAKQGKSVTADGQSLKDVPLDFVRGNIVVFRQPTESMFPAGFTLVYFMDSDESAQAMKEGKLPYKLVPDRSVSQAFTSSPITDVWKKANDKGQGGILGMLQGVTDDKEIYVDKMTVRPGFKRQSMTTKMVDTLKRRFPRAAVNFSSPTDEGSKFIKAYTGNDWKKPQVRESVRSLIEKGAHASRLKAALVDVDPEPTEAEIEAGNYAKGHVHLHGLDITIENAKGSTRSGTDKSGKEWSVEMPASYGYIKGTTGKDKDHLDVYIGPDPASELVVIVNQQTLGGRFDEHKVLLGFSNEKKAVETYDKAYSCGLGPKLRQSVATTTMAGFKKWIKSGDHKKQFKAKLTESAESIVASSIRLPDGSEFDGVAHYDALMQAVEAGKFGDDPDGMLAQTLYADFQTPRYVDGFRTSTGRFVDRGEALMIAKQSQQVDPDDAAVKDGWLDSAELDYVKEHVMAGAERKTQTVSAEGLHAELVFGDIAFKQFTEKHPYASLQPLEKQALKKAILRVVTERFHHAPGSPSYAFLWKEIQKFGGDHVEPVSFGTRSSFPALGESSKSGFRMPENWDKLDKLSQTEFSIHAGANDWENTLTAAAAYFGGKDRGERVWITLDIPGSDADTRSDEACEKDAGDKLVKEWLKQAKAAKKKAEAKAGVDLSWKPEFFVAAAKELGDSVKDYGVERSNWTSEELVEALLSGEDDDGLDAVVGAELRKMKDFVSDEAYEKAESLFLRMTRNVTSAENANVVAADVIKHVARKFGIVDGTDDQQRLVSYVNGLLCRHFPEDEGEDDDF